MAIISYFTEFSTCKFTLFAQFPFKSNFSLRHLYERKSDKMSVMNTLNKNEYFFCYRDTNHLIKRFVIWIDTFLLIWKDSYRWYLKPVTRSQQPKKEKNNTKLFRLKKELIENIALSWLIISFPFRNLLQINEFSLLFYFSKAQILYCVCHSLSELEVHLLLDFR